MNAFGNVLVAGGTTESREVVAALLAAGFAVVLSLATTVPMDLPPHPHLRIRRGRLDHAGFVELADVCTASAIVDAAHPFAISLHETLRDVAQELHLPLFRFARAATTLGAHCQLTADHEEAAELAGARGEPMLLTVGTRHLAPYVIAARRQKIILQARVLFHAESQQIVTALGLRSHEVTYARGPFTVDENLRLIRRVGARTLVTKESGREGGLLEKIEAASLAACHVFVVARPRDNTHSTSNPHVLIEALIQTQKVSQCRS